MEIVDTLKTAQTLGRKQELKQATYTTLASRITKSPLIGKRRRTGNPDIEHPNLLADGSGGILLTQVDVRSQRSCVDGAG